MADSGTPETAPSAEAFAHTTTFRVRYSETDQLGTFYNSRALEWFEVGRTELLRALGLTYAEMERRGAFLPLVEAHVAYRGRARYDDLLAMTSQLSMAGKASLRFDVEISHAAPASGARPARTGPVVAGHTVHGITDATGKAMRCPAWLAEAIRRQAD